MTAEAEYSMGNYYLLLGQPKNSLQYLQRAIEIRKNILGYENESTVRYLESLAQVYETMGEQSEAEKSRTEAEILANRLGMR